MSGLEPGVNPAPIGGTQGAPTHPPPLEWGTLLRAKRQNRSGIKFSSLHAEINRYRARIYKQWHHLCLRKLREGLMTLM